MVSIPEMFNQSHPGSPPRVPVALFNQPPPGPPRGVRVDFFNPHTWPPPPAHVCDPFFKPPGPLIRGALAPPLLTITAPTVPMPDNVALAAIVTVLLEETPLTCK